MTVTPAPPWERPPALIAVAEPVNVRTAGLLAPVPDAVADEIKPFVHDLFDALRPSLRERAATALSEGRYASRPEVKAILARAALLDPAPAVRAHVIKRLAKLGYHEPTYLAYLDACAESGHPAVKQAAVDALAKLTSRN